MRHLLLLALALVGLIFSPVGATPTVFSRTKRIPGEGDLRYHYFLYHENDDRILSSSSSACDTVMLIGVGTAMSVNDYDMLGHYVVTASHRDGIVFVVMDHNPHWMVKTDAKRYAALASTIVQNVATILPEVCGNRSGTSGNSKPRNGFIIGGHSASGLASIQALEQNLFLPAFQPIGLFGLDPFDVFAHKDDMNITIPAMFWGFSKTTCDVNVNKAAEYAYERTSNMHRVFYQVDNRRRSVNKTHQEITHCVFTDNGCGGPVCSASTTSVTDEAIRMRVGETTGRFVRALVSGDFKKRNFVLKNNDIPIHVFVGRESPQLPFGTVAGEYDYS